MRSKLEARTLLLVTAFALASLGCRPPEPEDPSAEVPEPLPTQAPVAAPEPPPIPTPEPQPPEVRFVLWLGEGIDLRLSHVDVAREHAAIVSCLTPAPDESVRPLRLGIAPKIGVRVWYADQPADDSLTACLRLAMRDVKLLDAAGQPVQTVGAWLELTMVINPDDADLSPPSSSPQLRVDSKGKCIERHESPCAPSKSCMPDLLVEVACPTNAGLATPTHDPASTLMLVWNDSPTPDRPRRLVVERWNELCSLEVREPPPTETDADYRVTRAGPIPCSLVDSLVADAKQVDRALRKLKPQISNLDQNLVNVHVNRLEPRWNAVQMVTDWAAPFDLLPEPSAQMQATLDAAIERWTLPITSAT